MCGTRTCARHSACAHPARTRTPALHAYARQWHDRYVTCARCLHGTHMHVCKACTSAPTMHVRARQRCTRTHVSGTSGLPHVLYACVVACTSTSAQHAHVRLRCMHAHARDARARTSAARAPYHMCSMRASWHAHSIFLHAHVHLRCMHAHARQRLAHRTTCALRVCRGTRMASACMHMCNCEARTRAHIRGTGGVVQT